MGCVQLIIKWLSKTRRTSVAFAVGRICRGRGGRERVGVRTTVLAAGRDGVVWVVRVDGGGVEWGEGGVCCCVRIWVGWGKVVR